MNCNTTHYRANSSSVPGDPTFSYENWLAAVKAGHTFVTTGPMLSLTVNGKLPGDTVDVARGATVRIAAEAFGRAGQVPLRSLEVVGHGQVLAKTGGANQAQLAVSVEIPMDRGMWIAARAEAGPGQVAHTTPVYVTVGGGGFHNPETLARNKALAEGYLKEVEDELAHPGGAVDNQAPRHRTQLERQLAEARERLRTVGQ